MATITHPQSRFRRPARARVKVSRLILALALLALFGRGLVETVIDLGTAAHSFVSRIGGCL